MTALRTVVLLRHARSVANAAAVLAGRSPGVGLDDTGIRQAAGLTDRFAQVPIARLVSSPLERCLATMAPLAAARGLAVEQDPALAEVDYGEWTGRPIKDLLAEPMWKTVQGTPSAAVFPGGEALAAVSARAVAGLHRLIESTTGDGALVVCSHGDVIKALLADALGLHLDLFQRIAVGPASVSVIRYADRRPFVERMGDSGTLDGIVAIPAPEPAGQPDPGPRQQAAESGTAAAQLPPDQAIPGGDTGVPAGIH
jgi:probable phosphoglycerate mutase